VWTAGVGDVEENLGSGDDLGREQRPIVGVDILYANIVNFFTFS
jgi:hypothetical protein